MVEVPRIELVDRCAVVASPLPDVPPLAELERCAATFGAGAVCFDPSNAWRLHALHAALNETWRAAQACAEVEQ